MQACIERRQIDLQSQAAWLSVTPVIPGNPSVVLTHGPRNSNDSATRKHFESPIRVWLIGVHFSNRICAKSQKNSTRADCVRDFTDTERPGSTLVRMPGELFSNPTMRKTRKKRLFRRFGDVLCREREFSANNSSRKTGMAVSKRSLESNNRRRRPTRSRPPLASPIEQGLPAVYRY
jgi:hypothetical protein